LRPHFADAVDKAQLAAAAAVPLLARLFVERERAAGIPGQAAALGIDTAEIEATLGVSSSAEPIARARVQPLAGATHQLTLETASHASTAGEKRNAGGDREQHAAEDAHPRG
jgi:hypothetical protein